jgi:aspartate racemase
MSNKKTIALIGGLGPLAGSDVLRKIFEYAADGYSAMNDADYPNVVLVSQGMSDFDETGNISPLFESEILSVVDQLDSHHPTLMGMACNTAHLYVDSIRKHTSAEFINIVEATVREASKQQGHYLILSSSTTRRSGLYYNEFNKQNVDYSDIDDQEQAVVDNIIGLVMVNKIDEANKVSNELLEKLAAKYPQATGVIAGCTELPIAFRNVTAPSGVTIIESNMCLAKALVDAYYNYLSANPSA